MSVIIPGQAKNLTVRLCTSTNLTLATQLEQGDVLDGQILVTGDRILVLAQTNQIDNGVYEVQDSGAPLRSFDAAIGMSFSNATVSVEEGTNLKDTRWMCISNRSADIIGTNNIVFQQISGKGVDGNVISNETSVIDNQIVVFNGISGTNIKRSTATVDSSNNIGNIGYVQFYDINEPANPANGQGRLYKKTGQPGLFWKPNADTAELDIAAARAGTASNIGVAGVGVFKQKVGNNFEFKRINPSSTRITVADDTANNEVDVDVVEANLTLSNMGGVLQVAKGGTGNTTFTSGRILQGNGTSAITSTLVAPSGAIVGTTDTQTLSNKSLIDFNTFIIDDLDNTKRLQFQCNSISTGVTRTLTAPDINDIIAVLTGIQTFTNKTITDATNNVTANGLRSLTTTVNVSNAAAPSALFCLRATSSTTATWQNIWIEHRNNTTLLVGNTTNTAITTAADNTIMGFQAGCPVTTGEGNTLIGRNAGSTLTTQNYNTFVGAYAGNVSTGSTNTYIGEWAGYYQTSGSSNISIGSDSFGHTALTYTGSNNTFVGTQSSTSLAADSNAVGVGWGTRSGNNGIALGYQSTAAANELAVRSNNTYVLRANASTLILPSTASTLTLGTNIMTFPTAAQTIAGLTSAQTFTNKTITDSTNNVTANGLRSATTTVAVSPATAPVAGQALIATSSTAATWQNIPLDLDWRGTWVSQNYLRTQVVFFGGSSYYCKLNTVSNNPPSDTTYWDLLAQQGASGPAGSGSSIIVKDESVNVTGTPHTQLNFIGPLVTVTNGGSGVANVTIAPIFGSQFQQVSDNAESTTTQTVFQQKLRLTTPSLPSGVYRIGYNFHWRHNSGSTNFRGQVQLNDVTTIMSCTIEPQDAGASQSHPICGFYYTSTISGVQFIDMDYCSSNASHTAAISTCRLEIWRVS